MAKFTYSQIRSLARPKNSKEAEAGNFQTGSVVGGVTLQFVCRLAGSIGGKGLIDPIGLFKRLTGPGAIDRTGRAKNQAGAACILHDAVDKLLAASDVDIHIKGRGGKRWSNPGH